jgi:hypothetical protein
MKNPIFAAIFAMLTLADVSADDSTCAPLKPGEARVSEKTNGHGGLTLSRTWRVDADMACEERIVMNADKTVRGRVITTYRGGKELMVLAYKGFAEPWFIDQYVWRKEGGYSVERRSFGGKTIVHQIFPSDENDVVKTLGADGNEITNEESKAISDEVKDLLF